MFKTSTMREMGAELDFEDELMHLIHTDGEHEWGELAV